MKKFIIFCFFFGPYKPLLIFYGEAKLLHSKIKPFKINFGAKNQSKKRLIQKKNTTKQRSMSDKEKQFGSSWTSKQNDVEIGQNKIELAVKKKNLGVLLTWGKDGDQNFRLFGFTFQWGKDGDQNFRLLFL